MNSLRTLMWNYRSFPYIELPTVGSDLYIRIHVRYMLSSAHCSSLCCSVLFRLLCSAAAATFPNGFFPTITEEAATFGNLEEQVEKHNIFRLDPFLNMLNMTLSLVKLTNNWTFF